MNAIGQCRAVHDHLADHLRGQLPPALSAEIAGHLRRCSACARAAALAKRLLALGEVPPVVPAGLAAAVLARQQQPSPGWSPTPVSLSGISRATARRAFVDPLLWLDRCLYHSFSATCTIAAVPLHAALGALAHHARNLCRHLSAPLAQTGRTLRAALAGAPQAL